VQEPARCSPCTTLDRDLFTRSINPCISAHYSRSEEPTAHPAGGRSEIGTPG
jgi:hypothetical protein